MKGIHQFYHCDKLHTFIAINLLEVPSDAFTGCKELHTLIVPQAKLKFSSLSHCSLLSALLGIIEDACGCKKCEKCLELEKCNRKGMRYPAF